jgi:hypothetical protein
MPKKISHMLTLDDETAYELQRVFQSSDLDFPTFLKEVVKMGLGKYDYFLYPGIPQEYNEEVEDQFVLEWIMEEEQRTCTKRRKDPAMAHAVFTLSEAQALQGKNVSSFYDYTDEALDICIPAQTPWTVTGWETRGEGEAVITLKAIATPPRVVVMDKSTFTDYFPTEPFTGWEAIKTLVGKYICPLQDYENTSLGVFIRHHTPCMVAGVHPWGWGKDEQNICIEYVSVQGEEPEVQSFFIDKAIYREYFGEPVEIPGELREPMEDEELQISEKYVLRTQSGTEYGVTASEGADERIILELSFDTWTKVCKDVNKYQLNLMSTLEEAGEEANSAPGSVHDHIPTQAEEPTEDAPRQVPGDYILRTPTGNEYLLNASEGGENRVVLELPFNEWTKVSLDILVFQFYAMSLC